MASWCITLTNNKWWDLKGYLVTSEVTCLALNFYLYIILQHKWWKIRIHILKNLIPLTMVDRGWNDGKNRKKLGNFWSISHWKLGPGHHSSTEIFTRGNHPPIFASIAIVVKSNIQLKINHDNCFEPSFL